MLENYGIQKQIGKLYPRLSPTERVEVEVTLRNYVGVVQRIFGQLSVRNPKVLTELKKRARLRGSGEKGA